ncbi:MAG: hypothetical protein K2Z81_03930 [Cyanobacteria bacterium]|nr:hypothetical protein [Cyanobacteriota bacterium]
MMYVIDIGVMFLRVIDMRSHVPERMHELDMGAHVPERMHELDMGTHVPERMHELDMGTHVPAQCMNSTWGPMFLRNV